MLSLILMAAGLCHAEPVEAREILNSTVSSNLSGVLILHS